MVAKVKTTQGQNLLDFLSSKLGFSLAFIDLKQFLPINFKLSFSI